MSFSFSPSGVPLEADVARLRASLAKVPIFSDLSNEVIEDLAQGASLRQVPSNQVVISQDEPGDTMFLIVTGRVRVGIVGENGREVTLSVLREGGCFGAVSVFDGKKRPANCVATEPTSLIVLNRQDLLKHMASNPATALCLLRQMAQRIREADDSIAQLALCDVNERLVYRLATLATEEGTQTPEGILIRRRPTQQELANMIGSCRETISRAFNQLSRDGLIIPRGRALIVTPALMAASPKSRAAAA